MTLRVTKSESNTCLRGEHDTTHAMTMTSRYPDDDNRTPSRHRHPYRNTASPPPRFHSPTPASSLVSLTVVVVVVAGLVGPVQAGLMDFSAPEEIQYGTCAQPKDQQPFDFRQFNGLWYQVEMVPNSYFEPKTCITLHFDWTGEAYNVTTKGLNEYNEKVQQDAMITKEQPQDPATSRPYLKIRASGVPPVPYHVIKTDYRRFACVYSCFELFALMFEAFSVLSRHAEVDHATHRACHQAFAALDLDLTRLHPVNQGGLCLAEGLEGSGEEPPRRDEEDEEGEEDENALVALTSEEVNPSGAPNAASDPRSDPAVEEHEGDALMEELEEEMEEEEEEEVQVEEEAVGEAQEEETGGSGNETSSFSEIKLVSSGNHAEGETQEPSSRTPGISDLEGKNSPARNPKKSHRRKKTKGGRRRGKGRGNEEDTTPSVTSRDQELYLDAVHLDFLYYPEEERGEGAGCGGGEGGRGGVREGGDEGDEASLPAHDHLSPHGGAGAVEASAPLLLLALLTLALCARVPPTH